MPRRARSAGLTSSVERESFADGCPARARSGGLRGRGEDLDVRDPLGRRGSGLRGQRRVPGGLRDARRRSRWIRRSPGARSGKVVLDRLTTTRSTSRTARSTRSTTSSRPSICRAPAHPLVPSLSEFNRTEYYSLDRRFILGAVTYYEGPQIWALELSPYDTASKEMITQLFAGGEGQGVLRRQAGACIRRRRRSRRWPRRCRRACRSRRPTRSSRGSTTSR